MAADLFDSLEEHLEELLEPKVIQDDFLEHFQEKLLDSVEGKFPE